MSTPIQHQVPSADDFLMGGGIPSAKFPAVGTTVTGRITEKPTVQQQKDYTTEQPKFWDDGTPMMQLVVTVATNERDPEITDDDGVRRIYVKGNLKTAVASAVRAAGARGLEVGGILAVTYTGDGEKKNPKFNAPKLFSAVYTSAANAELNTPDPAAPAGVNTATGEVAAPAAAPQVNLNDPAIQALIAAQAAQQAAAASNGSSNVPAF